MKVMRYTASGITQRSGIEEMFCVRWLETASKVTDPIAESASQSAIWRPRGRGSSAVAAICPPATVSAGSARLFHASAAQHATQSAEPDDHQNDCSGIV